MIAALMLWSTWLVEVSHDMMLLCPQEIKALEEDRRENIQLTKARKLPTDCLVEVGG
jgi:hypothetical protein